MISRRTFLRSTVATSAVAILPTASLAMAVAEPQWLALAKQWAEVMLPDDEQGPGVNSSELWVHIFKTIAQKPEVEEWLATGFQRVNAMGMEINENSLDRLLDPGSPVSGFMHFYFELLLKSYYGSEAGWHDLGIANPPQPVGYSLESSLVFSHLN